MLCLLPIVPLIGFLAFRAFYTDLCKFRQADWKTHSENRYLMMDDLLRQDGIHSQTQKSLAALLGTPEKTEKPLKDFHPEETVLRTFWQRADAPAGTPVVWYYLLQDNSFLQYDETYLAASFDTNGQIERYAVENFTAHH